MLKLNQHWRRALLTAAALTITTSSILHEDVSANALGDGHWVGSWATAPQGVIGAPSQYSNQTLRLIVRTSVGGNQVRVRLSNELGRNASSSVLHASLFGVWLKASTQRPIGR